MKKNKQLDNSSVVDLKKKNNKKSLSYHDLRPIKPLTDSQRHMIESYCQGMSILALGSAGTGKSLLALYMALNDVLHKDRPYNNIKIVRSIVPSRDIGYLPGDMDEKISVYEVPYRELFSFLFGMPTSYDRFKEFGTVEFMPTSFLRGQTWDNSIIVVDEVQNMNIHEINTVMTRVGTDSKVFLLGDSKQTDLYKHSKDQTGISILENALRDNKFFDTVYFTKDDIVRSEFVKSWICGLEDVNY